MLKTASISLFLCLTSVLLAQEKAPSLGLVLSGGGAKGLAHIGVIRELEKAGIYPDMISGTSMGSIVGGLYAIGYSPSELDKVGANVVWSNYFSDSFKSTFIPIEQRHLSHVYQLSFPIDSNGIVIPRGLLKGRKIQTLLALLFSPSKGARSFDDFQLPFRAVATNIVTGEPYVFKDGVLHRAIRASMAIPSIFAPVTIHEGTPQEKLLVDGLVVRNLPVQEVLDMGAEIVLAVDVGAPLAEKDELDDLISILQQTTDFGSIAFNDEQRKLADVIIDPDLGDFTALSYADADSIIALGAASTRAALPNIIKDFRALGLSVPMEKPADIPIERDSLFITGISFECEDPAAVRILEKLFKLGVPGLVTNEELELQINRLYGSGFFDFIDFYFEPNVNGSELIISATPVLDWQVRFSAAYDSDYEIGLLVNLTGRNVIGNGSLTSFDARISQFPRASLEYTLYTQNRPSIGLSLSASANFYPGRVFEADELTSEFRAHHFSSHLGIFSGLGENRYIEFGVISENISSNDRFITLEPNNNVINRQALFLELIRDTYDQAVFPSRGARTNIFLQRSFRGTERSVDNTSRDIGSNFILTATHDQIIPIGKSFAFVWESAGGFVQHNRSNLLNQLYLGRPLAQEPFFFNAYGKRHMELHVSGFATSALGLRWEITPDNFIGLHYQYGVYATSETELVEFGDNLLNPDRQSSRLSGAALTLGSNTFIGPIRFNIEYDPRDGSKNFNLHFGFYF